LEARGALPARPGAVLGRVPVDKVRGEEELTPDEQAILEKAGWTPGEPMPNLRGTKVGRKMQLQVEQVREKAEDYHGISPIDPSTPPLEPPEPVDINSLTGEEREKAEQLFAEMDELQARVNAARAQKAKKGVGKIPPHVMAKPGAAAAIHHAQQAAEEAAIDDDMAVIADQEPPQEMPKSPFLLKRDTEEAVQAVNDFTEEKLAENSSHDQVSDAGADLTGAHTHCPRCNFDLNGELITPEPADVASYLSMVMGKGRFRKEVSLFGGRVVVTFRSLLPREVDAAMYVVDQEMKNEAVHHVLQYAREVENFKLAAGVESVRREGQAAIRMPEWEAIEDTQTQAAIEQMKSFLDNEVFTTDAMRRAVAVQWMRFNQLQLYIDAKADDPSFFDQTA
jgi:hypothetical protein